MDIAHRGTVQPLAGGPAQNGPKCPACWGLARGGSGEATGYSGWDPPPAGRSSAVLRPRARGSPPATRGGTSRLPDVLVPCSAKGGVGYTQRCRSVIQNTLWFKGRGRQRVGAWGRSTGLAHRLGCLWG